MDNKVWDLNKKLEYNALLGRLGKAELFLNDKSVPMSKREKWIGEYNNIIKSLSTLIYEYHEVTGTFLDSHTTVYGFDI